MTWTVDHLDITWQVAKRVDRNLDMIARLFALDGYPLPPEENDWEYGEAPRQ